MNTITATTPAEICDALIHSSKGNAVILNCGEEMLLSQFRALKKCKHPVKGRVELVPDNFKGTNIRKVNLGDADAVCRAFMPFTTVLSDKLRRPLYDAINNGLVASDGRQMLVCRIPEGIDVVSAHEAGFKCNPAEAFQWVSLVDEMSPTEYNLSAYKQMATIRKGDGLHGLLEAAGATARAYEHFGFDGSGSASTDNLNAMRLWIGGKAYNAEWVANLVDGLFRLGSESVVLCERKYWGLEEVDAHAPLHIYGLGGKVDAKGLLMPIRRYGEVELDTGAFVLPTEEVSSAKVA